MDESQISLSLRCFASLPCKQFKNYFVVLGIKLSQFFVWSCTGETNKIRTKQKGREYEVESERKGNLFFVFICRNEKEVYYIYNGEQNVTVERDKWCNGRNSLVTVEMFVTVNFFINKF